MFNSQFLIGACDVIAGFVPVDVSVAANDGDYVNLANWQRCCVIYYGAAAGSGTEHPTITLSQATSAAGAGAKALNFTRYLTKIGTQTGIGQWTEVTQSSGNSCQPTSATSQKLIAIEISAEDLDVNNGFTWMKAAVADVGSTAQIGALLYIMAGNKYPQEIPLTSIS